MAPSSTLPERRGAFGGFIGPQNLVAQVRVAAPYLFDGTHPREAERPREPLPAAARLHEAAFHPLGFWAVLFEVDRLPAAERPDACARTDYFALCLGAHYASVATFVPTDVDAKIRHALWFEEPGAEELARMNALAEHLGDWDVAGFSARNVSVDGHGVVAGHDGERLSVFCGALLGNLAAGDSATAARFEARIDAELARQAAAFDAVARRPGDEQRLLLLAATLAHNAGDVDQGFAAKGARRVGARERERFTDLARSGRRRYGGAYARAAELYRRLLAREGHRHYPLREVKELRVHPDLLLPLGPFFDDWGERVARSPHLDLRGRAAVVAALVDGLSRVPGQEGYVRALAGFDRAFEGGLESRALAAHLGAATRRALKDSDLRRRLAVKRVSFESSLCKAARRILAETG